MRKTSLRSKYKVNPTTGCWEWKNPLSNGYGLVRVGGGRQRGAHIVMFERLRGPIPSGMELDHLCRNPCCVNPAHLEPVTSRTNIRRGKATKVNVALVEELRERYAKGETLQALSNEYKLCVGHLCEIVRGKYWSDAGGPIVHYGKHRPCKGRRKFSDDEIDAIRRLRADGMSRIKVAAMFKTHKMTISRIVNFRGCYVFRGTITLH